MKRFLFPAIPALLGLVHILLPYHVEFTGYVLLLLAAGISLWMLLRKKEKRRLASALMAAMVLCTAVLSGAMGVIALYARGSENPRGAYLVVLGAQTHGNVPSRTLRERLDRAADFMAENPTIPVILSGGKGTDETAPEAEVMYRYLEGKGADMSCVHLESRSTNTRENLRFSGDLAQDLGLDRGSAVILSSEFHLARAGFIARSLGMKVTTVAAETKTVFLKWNYYVRETFSFVKAFAQA